VTDELAADEAEKLVIGSLMHLDAAGARGALADIDDGDFRRGPHRDILAGVRSAAERGRPELPAVADELDRKGLLEGSGGAAYLANAAGAAPSSLDLERHYATVADYARRRRLRDHAQQLAAAAADPTADVDEAVYRATDQIASDRRGTGLITVSDVADDVRHIHRHGRRSGGVEAGWKDLDEIWRAVPGQLQLVTGIPGHGKSAWLDALAARLAHRHSWRVTAFAPESGPTPDHAVRIATAAAGAPFWRLTARQLDAWLAFIDEHWTWIDHDEHMTLPAVLSQARVAADRYGCEMLIIDPWTELDASRDTRRREDEWLSGELTRLRVFARKNNIACLVAVHPKQLEKNRDGTYPVPHAGVLHGGSVWRKKADSLISIWRDAEGATQQEEITDIHVQKIRRNGVDGHMGRRATLKMHPPTGDYHPAANNI
jgi:replicative DNA helicase